MTAEIFELSVHSLSHDGRAVGRLENRVIFVEGALPGQTIRAKVLKSKKNFAEAQCIEVLKEAPDSITAPCAHASHCGGCALQTMPAETQLEWKERMVVEAMTRIAKLSPEALECIAPIVPSPAPWGYRNKMEFAFGQDAEKNLTLGLRAKASHEVHDVPHCRLLPEGCMDVVQRVKTLCQNMGLRAWGGKETEHEASILRHLVVRCPRTPKNSEAQSTQQLLLNLITAPASRDMRLNLTRLGKELMQSCPQVTGFVLEERRSASMVAQGEHGIATLGDTVLQEQLGGIDYSFGHNAFFQINTAAAENLCSELKNMAGPLLEDLQAPEVQHQNGDTPCIWDVYCGVGAPGLNLASAFKTLKPHLYGVEINPKAIGMAQRNAQYLEDIAHISQAQYVANDAKRALKAWPAPQIILLDPPRAGLAPEVVAHVAKSEAKYILYVSCNPATLARDVALLGENYALEKLVPFDFFPQTPHVESCALLVKKSS